MPVVSLTLEDTNRSILSQSYFKIVEDIISAIKIPSDSLVVMHKDMDITKTDNRSNVSNAEVNNLPTTMSKRRTIVNITEEYNEDALTTTAVHQVSSYPIFEDTDVNVHVFPIHVKTDVNIEFSFISPSKTEANRIRDDIRIRLSQSRNITIHDIEYDIIVPEVVENFISDVYDLKNRLIPQPMEDYFKEHSTKRAHLITDLSNPGNAKIAVREKQIRIVGLFDFSPMPDKIENDNENNNYKLTFNYKLSIDVPRAIGIRYPVMICNKPLPSKYLDFISDNKINSKEERKRELGYTKGLFSLSYFEAHRQLENRVDINLPINIPLFDDFHKRVIHKGYAILVSFLTDVNEIDKKSLFNLRDIDPYYIPEELLQFIINTERTNIINPYMSFMYLGLYQEDTHYDNNILTLDSDLNITSKVELKLFKPVRVLLSLCIDITMLDQRCINRLLDNPNILYIYLTEYINAINNYKKELSTLNIPNFNIYRFFILAINYYRNKDLLDIIFNILNITYTDSYIFSNLLNLVYKEYPDMYHYLSSNKIITTSNSKVVRSIDTLTGNETYSINHKVGSNINVDIGAENYNIKTLMTNNLISLRMEDLQK